MAKRILVVVGTRPNFIKVTCFREVASLYPNIDLKIVHTGQHYDGKMADVFFEQFNLIPDYFLNVPPGSPNSQMAEIMLRLEKTISEFRPDVLAVVGDVNSTLAAAITANKTGIKLAHIESGLRSFDKNMPEEWNRVITDNLSDICFVTEPSGLEHLKQEGKKEQQVFFVGNTMIDTLVAFKSGIDASRILEDTGLQKDKFVLMTMHRPSNVDDESGLRKLLTVIKYLTATSQVIFPVHPRTVARMKEFGLYAEFSGNDSLHLSEPLDYFSFQKLVASCELIITDSGGIQEESTFVLKPCITLRENTERPVTVTEGTNELIEFDLNSIRSAVETIRSGKWKKGNVPALWDGRATERIFDVFNRIL